MESQKLWQISPNVRRHWLQGSRRLIAMSPFGDEIHAGPQKFGPRFCHDWLDRFSKPVVTRVKPNAFPWEQRRGLTEMMEGKTDRR